jgi:hypothetical protein
MAKLGNITFACKDPAKLAGFWASALDYTIEELPQDLLETLIAEGADLNMAAAISDPEGKGPRLFFEKKEKSDTATIPIHLDLNTPDVKAEVARLIALGAQEIGLGTQQIGPYTNKWMVMKDPEGNGFCVQ